MTRKLIAILVLVAPALVLPLASGCAQKITTVQKTERIEQSEPQMVSPGEEVLE